MPNPFPGVDPYLETSVWSSFQRDLISEIGRTLAATVGPEYLIRSAQREVREISDRMHSDPSTEVFLRVQTSSGRCRAVIEVRTTSNKFGTGLEQYQRHRRDILLSDAHLIEIDLLRMGEHFPTPADPPPAPYYVFLSHADDRVRLFVWPIPLESRLPTVTLPLRSGAAVIDLQAAYNAVYERYRYDQPEEHQGPLPGLSPEQAAWAEERLRAAGLR
jgi:hypothetical protein